MRLIINISMLFTLSITLCYCSDSKKDQASDYLSAARKYYYYSTDIHSAQAKIDSIHVLFPQAYTQIASAKLLKDSIVRDLNKRRIDSLDDQISVYKREIYSSNKPIDKETLLSKIDSLELLKVPYRNIVQQIKRQEAKRAAQCQCKTIMQNR